MGNKEWDNYLRELLGDFKTEGETPHWEEFAEQLDSNTPPGDEADLLADENLKSTLSSYNPDAEVKGWEQIEARLNAEDREFDEHVRKKINHYEPAYDPHSWPLFLKQFSANKLLRTKLIVMKVTECAALLLMIITVINISRQGQFPFSSEPQEETTPPFSTDKTLQDKAYNSVGDNNAKDLASYNSTPIAEIISPATTNKTSASKKSNATNKTTATASKSNQSSGTPNTSNDESIAVTVNQNEIIAVAPVAEEITKSNDALLVETEETSPAEKTTLIENVNTVDAQIDLPVLEVNETYITEALALSTTSIAAKTTPTIPLGKLAASQARKYFEFGMLAQVDYNQLKMPTDRLYSFGQTTVFPLEGITSPGYGGGFTLAVGHPNWAVETGLVYSAKTFKPNRQLTVGDEMDHGNVEFEAMRLQLVSVPLQFRYRFEPKGRLKAYALAGFGMHVIVQSDIDIMVKYNFASLAAGEDPNKSPALAQTIRETKRITEDFKDGAPFSTKSFISANLGLGLEYVVRENKMLFLQTAYQYQVPNLRFSNHNGKHILSLSLQAGVRTALGF